MTKVPETSREERLRVLLQHMLDAAKSDLQAWRSDFDKSPHSAFKWGDSAFAAAAKERVVRRALSILQRDGGLTFDQFVAEVTRLAIESVRDRSKSTSTCSNLLSQSETEAWAIVVEATQTVWE